MKDQSLIATFLGGLGSEFPNVEIASCFPFEGNGEKDFHYREN